MLKNREEALVFARETEQTRAGAAGARLERAGNSFVRGPKGSSVDDVMQLSSSAVRAAYGRETHRGQGGLERGYVGVGGGGGNCFRHFGGRLDSSLVEREILSRSLTCLSRFLLTCFELGRLKLESYGGRQAVLALMLLDVGDRTDESYSLVVAREGR